MAMKKISCSAVCEERRTLFKYIRGFKNLLFLKALFYFGVLRIAAYLDLPRGLAQRLIMCLQDSISFDENNFEASISDTPRGLCVKRAAKIESADWAQKKICWMKKNPVRNGAVSTKIGTHRANHPNHLLIRHTDSEAELRLQELVDGLRIGFAASLFHDLTDKPVEH
jgi:hypothetical protein